MSFIRFDTLWLCHLGQAGHCPACPSGPVGKQNLQKIACLTFVCKDLLIFVFVKCIWICTRFCTSAVFLPVCVCILRVEGWRKSPLLRCWKLAQASIADFSRPQNWIYWLTLSAVSFENRLMIGTMCFSSQRRKVREYRPLNLEWCWLIVDCSTQLIRTWVFICCVP